MHFLYCLWTIQCQALLLFSWGFSWTLAVCKALSSSTYFIWARAELVTPVWIQYFWGVNAAYLLDVKSEIVALEGQIISFKLLQNVLESHGVDMEFLQHLLEELANEYIRPRTDFEHQQWQTLECQGVCVIQQVLLFFSRCPSPTKATSVEGGRSSNIMLY